MNFVSIGRIPYLTSGQHLVDGSKNHPGDGNDGTCYPDRFLLTSRFIVTGSQPCPTAKAFGIRKRSHIGTNSLTIILSATWRIGRLSLLFVPPTWRRNGDYYEQR